VFDIDVLRSVKSHENEILSRQTMGLQCGGSIDLGTKMLDYLEDRVTGDANPLAGHAFAQQVGPATFSVRHQKVARMVDQPTIQLSSGTRSS